jgi:hypothetical protein
LSQLPGVSEPSKVIRQMRHIGGVVFHGSGPTGLSLTSELRGELRAVAGQPLPQHKATENPAGGTICELLGAPANASLEEIEAAYEKWIWRSRHERPGGHGLDWTEQSERQVKAVNAAYEAFLRAHKPKEAEESTARIETVWQQFRRSQK